jgi:2-keto-3-deoxy-L-rhamnonate aldolase RhmA
MVGDKLRQILKGDRFSFGLTTTLSDPSIIEIAAYEGFDYIITMNHDQIGTQIRTAEAVGIPIIVKIWGQNPDPVQVRYILDLGPDGINFVWLESKEQAERIVRMCRTAPYGDREVFPGARIGRYWGIPIEEFAKAANSTAIGVRIETRAGLENAEEIFSVPGIDFVNLGPSDLSQSLGVKRDSQTIINAQLKLMRLAKKAGIAFQQAAMVPEDVAEWLKREPSLRFFRVGIDVSHMAINMRRMFQRANELVPELAKETAEGKRQGGKMLPWRSGEAAKG